MQGTYKDSFTRLYNLSFFLKETASKIERIKNIVDTDFTFGRTASFHDNVLWYGPRSMLRASFIEESYSKCQRLLEGILGKGDPRVEYALSTYCKPFIENHQDLSSEQKKTLHNYCIEQTKEEFKLHTKIIHTKIEGSLEATFPLIQQIHNNNLIQFNKLESIFLEGFLNKNADISFLEHFSSYLGKQSDGNFLKLDIFIYIMQKFINYYSPDEEQNVGDEEWTLIDKL